MREIVIRENESGQRLDKFLAKYMALAPKSFFYKMMRKKNITLNGKKAQGKEQLKQGDMVKLFLSDETVEKFRPKQTVYARKELDILYEDRHTLFVNKPAGMLSQKAKPSDQSLVEYLTAYLLESRQLTEEELRTFHPSVCNRLDRNTSGIVAAGKTLAALQTLSAMFRERSVRKYYLCLVYGVVSGEKKIRAFLTKDGRTNRVTVERKKGTPNSGADISDGKESFIETEYRALRTDGEVTLMEVHLITGKTHQIRAHLAAEGYPIIGDYKYGNRDVNDIFRRKYGLTSQLLHSYRLCFPECEGELAELSGKEIKAPVPELFRKICADRGVM
ncbi:RluA family pseudouridine synthase [Mediterraneibacter glycyrrhizinilyticus]|uniref:RluA family pseudouridine synthase n=1 Tax=Mediterraneibacter glycyrrhizinilyticus TaxID=342942 RepID=UPI00196046A5|nr:RluA family pseudouridine synthase [Mediterraneibacter glycyrrhizinilyticus]MBM6750517.1 RluA family pseudouridine synthase [Mediterraneibacter glycyrrhizinilyticus]